ncbi:MAG: hypothetical protein Q8P59_00220, partial [Dehalococcoidia bacterium]|nr:hypothetical protein [Dehalococcoidia bacterium]
MATVRYVNGTTGDNAWDGTSPVYTTGTTGPKKTIVGARAVTTNGSLVLIAPGVYLGEPVQAFNSANDAGVVYRRDPRLPGRVIVDWEQSPTSLGGASAGNVNSYWLLQQVMCFMDIHFRNAYSSLASVATLSIPYLIHCVFYQKDGTAQTSYGVTGYNGPSNLIFILNCTFYNLNTAIVVAAGLHYGNYFVGNIAHSSGGTGVNAYSAWPGATGTGNINTSTGANPGLTDAPNEDFSLDPVSVPADWETFMVSGFQGGSIGAWGNGGILYTPNFGSLKFLSPDPNMAAGNPQPGWENDTTYADGTPGDII